MSKPERRYPRIETSQPVVLQVPEWSGLEARCRDISYGGVCLLIPHEVQVGDELVFDLTLDGMGRTALRGVVRHATQLDDGTYVVGVSWESPGARHEQLVKAFVDNAA